MPYPWPTDLGRDFTLCHGLAIRANLKFRLTVMARREWVTPRSIGEFSPWDNVSACYNEYLWQIRFNRAMKSKPHTLPGQPGRLIALILCMQPFYSQGLAEQTPGKPLVLEAAKQLLQLPSFETRIRQTIDLAGQQLVGTGTYRQSGTPF